MEQALSGVRILDLSRYISGPFCCQILGDNGAEVIKVEKPTGEPGRAIPPFVKNHSLYFMAYNGSKRGITLNFRSTEGLALLRRLMGKADVVVENFRAGTMEKMGLGYDTLAEINPRLILVSISGFGTEGPYAGRPAFDEIIQSMSGLASLTGPPGSPPSLAATFVADFVTGLYGAIAVLLALQVRSQSGRGQWVQANLFHSLVSILNTMVSRHLMLGEVPQKWGNRNANVAPGNVYRVKDGHVTIECITQEMWEGLARAMGREDLTEDTRFTDSASRFRNADALDSEIDSWILSMSTVDVLAVLERHSVPCGPVLDVPTLVKHPQFVANRIIETVEHPEAGSLPLFAPAIRLIGDAAPRRGCPPRLGEHTDQVLREWLGLSPGEIAALRASGAV